MTDLLFDNSSLPRSAPIRRMHVKDAGSGMIRFECSHCGHDTGWIEDTRTVSENKRGLPCQSCNGDQS